MCSIAARISANALEIAKHDVRVDVAQCWMKERVRKRANDRKFEALPQFYGAIVGTDDEIKLHGAKSTAPSAAERMLAHRAGDPAAGCGDGCQVAAICNVPTATVLIGLQKVGADNFAVFFRNKDLVFSRKPIRERACLVHVAREGISFACADDGFHDGPDGVRVCVSYGPDQHPRILPWPLLNADEPPDSIEGPAFTRLNWTTLVFELRLENFSGKHKPRWHPCRLYTREVDRFAILKCR